MTTSKIFNRTISVFAAFLVLLCSMTLYSDNSRAANTAYTYTVYDAITATSLRHYNLMPLSSENKARGVVGNDTRTTDWTKSGVVKITYSYINGEHEHCTGHATGFVVDDHVIATAAHCVYYIDDHVPKKITNIILFNSDGSVNTTATPVEYHLPSGYLSQSSYSNRHDFALITVKEDLSEYACFNLGVPLDNIHDKNLDIKATGFPGKIYTNGVEETANTVDEHLMLTGEGSTYKAPIDYLLYYDTDVTAGNSGGPIYIEESRNGYTYNTVIAIHTTSHNINNVCTYNSGQRISTNLIHFYLNNANLIWE